MGKEFTQIEWDDRLASDWAKLLNLSLSEDLDDVGDWTSAALIAEDIDGQANVVSRQEGVIAGLPLIQPTLAEFDPALEWLPAVEDGEAISVGACVGTIQGPGRSILVAERLLLNALGRLSGIATLTRTYVQAISGCKAKIYDTRKTTPGWRRLEKYAVRMGGGCNHRIGLFEAVLIKDNHLAIGGAASEKGTDYAPAESLNIVRDFIRRHMAKPAGDAMTDDAMTGRIEAPDEMILEIEVDTLQQLEEVLPAGPDIVLLDNMKPPMLKKAVAMRDQLAPEIELEASGGVSLKTVRKIAESGVDRISIGALTHSAVSLDLGLDWVI